MKQQHAGTAWWHPNEQRARCLRHDTRSIPQRKRGRCGGRHRLNHRRPLPPAKASGVRFEQHHANRHADILPCISHGRGHARIKVVDEQSAAAYVPEKLLHLRDGALTAVHTSGRRRVEPGMLSLERLHGRVESLELRIPKQRVFCEVPATACHAERVTIRRRREVDPLGVAKLVTHEIEIGLAAERTREQPHHLMQGHATLDRLTRRGEQ